MPASPTRVFENGLDSLFRQYSAQLRRDAGRRTRGKLPKLTRPKLRKRIDRLVGIAAQYELKKHGKRRFTDATIEKRQWHVKRGKGWGLAAKKKTFAKWYDRAVHGRSCVYVFWKGRQCIYVGRTGAGGRRPQAHFEKYWFSPVSRIDLYIIRGKRQLPMAECLAIHLFNPAKNKVKSAQQKWRSNCPVCAKEVHIRKMLTTMFPLKRRRRRAV
jgi:hypothetical protein